MEFGGPEMPRNATVRIHSTTKYPQESREDPDMTSVMNYHIHEFAYEAESKQTGLANRYSLIPRPLFVTLQFVFTTTHTQNGKVMESSFTM